GFRGSAMNVGVKLPVGSPALLVLGCEPEAFICFNDPDQTVGTLSTNDHVGGNLTAGGALMVLAHHNAIAGNLAQSGGGGGVNCSTFPLGASRPPAFSTYDDDTIGRNAPGTGLRTCRLGVIRNTRAPHVHFNDNP